MWFNATVTSPRWRIFGAAVVLALSARLCYLVIRYHGGGGAIKRPHIESAALLLAVVGFVLRFATDTAPSNSPTSRRIPPIGLWLGLVCAATVLYWPALFVGLLSDDFVLVQHALAWEVGEVAPQLFRPLPMFVWALIVHLGGGPVALHALNILLHATNAFLAMRIAAAWVPGRWWTTAAGFMVLAAPLGPEAVVWAAGVFDLFAAAFIMAAVLVARRYQDHPRIGDRLLLLTVSVAALLSKEIAVVVPMLVLLDCWVRRSLPRALVADLALVAAVVAAFAAFRLASHTGLVAPAFSKYRVQRLVFDSFGSLAAPWHVDFIRAAAIVRPVNALAVICLVSAFFVNRGARWRSISGLAGAAWVLVSVIPLLSLFYVGAQLEGARYLYLAAFGWAALLMTAGSELCQRGRWPSVLVTVIFLAMIAVAAVGVRVHLAPWIHAAAVRDEILRIAAADARLHSCPVAYVRDLPESVEGAYLFRNGARDALADVGINAFVRNETGTCSFRWDGPTATFVPAFPIP